MSKKHSLIEANEKFRMKHPDWEIIFYTNMNGECVARHKCGNKKKFKSYYRASITNMKCDKCENDVNWKYEVGDIIDDIQITNRMRKTDAKKNACKKFYQYRCLKCGFDQSKEHYLNGVLKRESWISEYNIDRGERCSCCRHKTVQSGINDVQTTDPDIVDYFVNKNEAKMYARGSNHKIQTLCPICGSRHPKPTAINILCKHGKTCLNCGSSLSYPERFMYSFLNQLNIKFEMHHQFEWSKHIENSNGVTSYKEYDFYIPEYNLIIETHGQQHYDGGFSRAFGSKTLDEEQENDELKKSLAIQNNYNYIVIDCRESYKDWIIKSIKNSQLNDMFNLNNIDWNKCNIDAIINIKKNAMLDKANNPNLTIRSLAEKYGVRDGTMRQWLKQGSEISGYFPKKFIKTPIYSPELQLAFLNPKQAGEILGICYSDIYNCLHGRNGRKTAGKHPETGEKLTWKRLTNDQYIKWLNQNNEKE